MNDHGFESNEGRLRRVVRQSRPIPALPPRFQESVWRRIERDDIETGYLRSPLRLERWVAWLLRPRLAIAAAALLVLLGGVMGVVDGTAEARQAARDQYVASVAPPAIR